MKCLKKRNDYDDYCFTYVSPQQPMEYDKNDPNSRADFFGEQLYAKFGIFLDLEDSVIDKLIKDDRYFNLQVRETIKLLEEYEKKQSK